MGTHARWCKQEQTDCLCLSCKFDNLFESPACCSRNTARFNPDDTICGVAECPGYEQEEDEDGAEEG